MKHVDCKHVDCQILVLGSGFAGSLLAMILKQLGYDVALVDRARHPRFAIGESSTPIANCVLADLARRYDLPRLLPLAKFGAWRDAYPEVGCGCKRGFSYFAHEENKPFAVRADHANELLVAASSRRETADTHWLRADIDAFLCAEAKALGVQLEEEVQLASVEYDQRWRLRGEQAGEPIGLRADFIIDATGASAWLAKRLGVRDEGNQLRTNSWAIYSHFENLAPWSDGLDRLSPAARDDHPFPCDDAAQHHLLDAAWLWRLQFAGGLTSAGLVFDGRRHDRSRAFNTVDIWQNVLAETPSLSEQFSRSVLASSPGRLIMTERLQRRLTRAAGHRWAALPHTAGFVDPLHSTGIAQSLCGVERLAHIFERREVLDAPDSEECLSAALCEYEHALFSELAFVDRLVSGCYDALPNFRLFAAYSMFYFAAATTYEIERSAGNALADRQFLCAEEQPLRRSAASLSRELRHLVGRRDFSLRSVDGFERAVAEAIRPYNQVGLCDPAAKNMIRHTAVSESFD